MKLIHRVYARMAFSVGAIGAGAIELMHPNHGVEHIGCILLGLVLGFLGLFGFRRKEKKDVSS